MCLLERWLTAQHGVARRDEMHPSVRVSRPTHPNGWAAGGRTILSSVHVTGALDTLLGVLAAPPEDATPRLSAALSDVLPHRAAAVLAGACARSPMTVHGEAGLADRVTSAELARLAATVPVGEAWRGRARVAGAERPVLAVAAATAGPGSLLVLVLADGQE